MAPFWAYLEFLRSSRNFGEDLEEQRNDKIYSSGNRGVKIGPGPWGTGSGYLLVPSLILTVSWLYPNCILTVFWLYPDCILTVSWLNPDCTLKLLYFNLYSCKLIFILFCFAENTGKLQVHHIHVPDPFILGSSSDLLCNYSWTHPEQEARPIYSIKWYKENAEFFRWVRIENWQWHLHTNSDEIALEHFFCLWARKSYLESRNFLCAFLLH